MTFAELFANKNNNTLFIILIDTLFNQTNFSFFSFMFEDLVSNLLSTYLGDYLEGLTKNDLKISLWKGDVEFRNLVCIIIGCNLKQVRTEALEFLNLPLQVKCGFVGKLMLKVTALFNLYH